MPTRARRFGVACLLAASGLLAWGMAEEVRSGVPVLRWRQHDIRRPKPPVVEPAESESTVAARPPKDAIVLFDGSNLGAWKTASGRPARWKVVDGYLETAAGLGSIETKAKFGDIQLHVEWAAPSPPAGTGQDRGNSGIFLMDQFEIQVLDSYQADTYADGQAGAIYGQYPPLSNASRPPGQWQTYDIAFRRPRFDSAGKLLEPARVTLFHNGILVQNNEEPVGPTSWLKSLPYSDTGDRGGITLQDHKHPVRYRNIWLRELPERPAPTARDLERPKVIALSAEVLDQCTGQYEPIPRSGSGRVKIVREDGHLVATFPLRPQPLVLEPTSETDFDMTHTDGHFTFQKDDQGKVTGFLFRIGDGERHMRKVVP